MFHSESAIFELVRNGYMINEKEILCAAYLFNPQPSPAEYLIVNSFCNKSFSKLNQKEQVYFLLSKVDPRNDKSSFLKFMNSKDKINANIISKIPSIRTEKYKDPEWEGVLFLADRRYVVGKIGIELFYDKYLDEPIENPFRESILSNFTIINANKTFSNPYKKIILELSNKFIPK